jgi:hypothetical protein
MGRRDVPRLLTQKHRLTQALEALLYEHKGGRKLRAMQGAVRTISLRFLFTLTLHTKKRIMTPNIVARRFATGGYSCGSGGVSNM